MKIIKIQALLLVFLLSFGCSTFMKKIDQVNDINKKGEKLLSEGKLDEALAEFNKATVIMPEHARALYGIATVYNKKGMVDKAILKYEEAQNYFPFNLNIMNALGNAYSKKGRIDEAIQIFNLALFNLKEEDLKAQILLNLGKLYYQKKSYNVALFQLKKVLKYKPLYSTAYYYIGKIYLEHGKVNAAIAEFDRAVKLFYLEDDKKYFSSVYKDYAEVLKKNGQEKRAKELLNDYKKLVLTNDEGIKKRVEN